MTEIRSAFERDLLTRVMRHQAQARHLQTQLTAFKWLYQDVLDPAGTQREGARRASLLAALGERLSECAAAHSRLQKMEAALTSAEDELLRGAGNASGINKEMVSVRVQQRRAGVRELGEWCAEVLGMAAALTELEHSRGVAPTATRRMDEQVTTKTFA